MPFTLGRVQLSLLPRDASPAPSARTPVASTPVASTLPNIAFSAYPVPTRYYYNPYDAPRNNLELVRETVSACMHARSEAVSRGMFHLYRLRPSRSSLGIQSPQRELLHEHPIERLLMQPNPLLDMSDILELVTQWLDATGNAILLKVRDAEGIVRELWPLPALNYDIERGDDGLPQFYRFQPTNTRVPLSEIIHIRRPDLRTAPLFGHAILSDMIESARADAAIRLFQERYFANDALPHAVLKWPEGAMLTQEQMDDLRARWSQQFLGPRNAGSLAILPDGGQIDVLSAQGKELDFRNSKQDLAETIMRAFHVPKIALGDVDGVNLANADTSYRVFLRDVVDMLLGRIGRALTRGLAREWSNDLVIAHEPILAESEAELMARIAQLKEAMTIDEQRAMLSLAPLPNGAGNRFVIAGTMYDAHWQRI